LAFRGKRAVKSGRRQGILPRRPGKEGNVGPCMLNGLGRQPDELDWDRVTPGFWGTKTRAGREQSPGAGTKSHT
jgi:hypothetical protein